MTRAQRDALRAAKHEACTAKSALIRLLDKVESASPREGRKLSAIIARLEDWQNTGAGS